MKGCAEGFHSSMLTLGEEFSDICLLEVIGMAVYDQT